VVNKSYILLIFPSLSVELTITMQSMCEWLTQYISIK